MMFKSYIVGCGSGQTRAISNWCLSVDTTR